MLVDAIAPSTAPCKAYLNSELGLRGRFDLEFFGLFTLDFWSEGTFGESADVGDSMQVAVV